MSRLSAINGQVSRRTISLLSVFAVLVFAACEQAGPTAPVTQAPSSAAVRAVLPCSRDFGQKRRDRSLLATRGRIQAARTTAHALAAFRCGLRPLFRIDTAVNVPTRKIAAGVRRAIP